MPCSETTWTRRSGRDRVRQGTRFGVGQCGATHLAFYAGWPNAFSAVPVLKEVFEKACELRAFVPQGIEDFIMNISFESQVALVTGAGSGLGLATAKAFAEAGASVVFADWNESAARAAADELAGHGHKTLAIRCDVADDAQVEAMVDQTVATFGRLDVAYNNAGVQNVLAETADSPRDDYDRVMAINLRGVWSCMKFELRQMRKQGSGAIVNCSSLGGLVGGAERGTYHAAKHGVLGLTKSAALEYAARGIRINAVCPGLIETPMAETMRAGGQTEALEGMLKLVPIGRYGRPEEIADAVLWLCSDRASFVVGQSVSVDGGFTMR